MFWLNDDESWRENRDFMMHSMIIAVLGGGATMNVVINHCLS